VKFKHVTSLCKYLGEVAQQDVIYKNTGRWVYKPRDFTAEEKKGALLRARGINDVLKAADKRTWSEVLAILRYYMPETHIGFKMQDAIIKTCSASGITIKMDEKKEAAE